MNYKYKSFSFICFALSVVTKEIATKVAPDNSVELFDAILYQKLDNADDDIKTIYSAWSIIRYLIEGNRAFLYRPYRETLNSILYNDKEYELRDDFKIDLLDFLDTLINQDKKMFNTFFEVGANRHLKELIEK